MVGISSILDIGKWALFGTQAAIQTTGNNIANVNTEGYSRRTVRFEELASIDYRPGQIGTGAKAAEVLRHFDEFVEMEYLDKASISERFGTEWENLEGVNSLFNESVADGIHASLDEFLRSWSDLAQRPDDYASREALLGKAEDLILLLNKADQDMMEMQQQTDLRVAQEVDDINGLLAQIADLNKQIEVHHIPGDNNANELFDRRALLVRKLGEKMDIKIIDHPPDYEGNVNGIGDDFHILTKAGHTLVQGNTYFELKYEGFKVDPALSMTSNFDGELKFDGISSFEYTVEVVQAGQVSNAGSAAMFRVSLDGGRTWLKDENGTEKHFYARPVDSKVTVGDIDIWFENATQNLEVGDTFSVMPRNGVYWYENTSSFMNITPQIQFDGTDNESKITGGSVAGLMNFSSYYLGRYRDKLAALTDSLVWEVNRLHSQGSGLAMHTDILGDYAVQGTGIPLGSNSSGLAFADRLTTGNVQVYVYDASNGLLASNSSYGPLDFDAGTAGVQNFDPAIHGLSDVAAAFNNTYGSFMNADIISGRLHLTSNPGYTFGFGADTSGMMAALGVNTFFNGESPQTLGLNTDMRSNLDYLNAGHINGAGESNQGDNATALEVAALIGKDVTIASSFETSKNQTLAEYFGTMVSTVGADTAGAKFAYDFNQALADDLNARQEAVSGVNLDEEMSDLIKFQHAYRAAAKLITTADQMLQTILTLKQ